MLFVFHIEWGMMLSFDMSLTLEPVTKLKEMIEKNYNIPESKQVLLISGGQPLEPHDRVCSYPAGTDTNPFFLSIKRERNESGPIMARRGIDDKFAEFTDVMKAHIEMQPNMDTLKRRAQLAQRIIDVTNELLKVAENCVHEQHLQQQGWYAVLANLEDSTTDFRKNSRAMHHALKEFLEERDIYIKLLGHYENDLITLKRLPYLSSFAHGETRKFNNLYDWISSHDPQTSLEKLYGDSLDGLNMFDQRLFMALNVETEEHIEDAENNTMKEIKGLSDRLSGLENIMRELKAMHSEQIGFAASVQKNYQKAQQHSKDIHLIKDTCKGHPSQLRLMVDNHNKMCDLYSRISLAKSELCMSLNVRVKWVTSIEAKQVELTDKIVAYTKKLQNLKSVLYLLEQLHVTPATYLSAVAEVVRRRSFSQSYLVWASDLACHMLTIHNEEVARRREFQMQFQNHFLNILFPGMEDMPPGFATDTPKVFDNQLPQITLEDVERLKKELPDLADNLNIPDTSAVTNFFAIKSIIASDKIDDSKPAEENLEQVAEAAVGNMEGNVKVAEGEVVVAAAQGLPHLKDLDKGCESETDTEEFEKVGQSPLDLNFDKEIPSPVPGRRDVATATEDNLQISRSEHDKLRSNFLRLVQLIKQALADLSTEVQEFKKYFMLETESFFKEHAETSNIISRAIADNEEKYKNLLVSVEDEQQKEREKHLETVERISAELSDLATVKADLETKLKEECTKNEEVARRLNEMDIEHVERLEELKLKHEKEKEMAIKEMVDKMTLDHKQEMEGMRTKFKYIMTMERSPSDSSLERTELSSNHEAIILQMAETYEMQKNMAIQQAVLIAKEEWQRNLDDKVRELKERYDREKEFLIQDVAKRVSEDKDKQIDILREREHNLTLECFKYKTTIQQLTEYEAENNSTELITKVEALEREKCMLEQEVERLKKMNVDMSTSVSVCEGKSDAATSPFRFKKERERSSVSSQSGAVPKQNSSINIDTCNSGDLVFIFWDKDHESFRILQNSSNLYFLHSDYLEGLGLQIVDKLPNKFHSTGLVVSKEYCHAKKPVNRYKVPKGMKFYRVKVKPGYQSCEMCRNTQKSTLQQTHNLWQSQSAATTTSEFDTSEVDPCQSLPASPVKLSPPILEEKAEEALITFDNDVACDSIDSVVPKEKADSIHDVVDGAASGYPLEERSEAQEGKMIDLDTEVSDTRQTRDVAVLPERLEEVPPHNPREPMDIFGIFPPLAEGMEVELFPVRQQRDAAYLCLTQEPHQNR